MNRQCSNCRFFKSSDPVESIGTCIRFPPVAGALVIGMVQGIRGNQPQITHYAVWARVAENEYCGEWTGDTSTMLLS